MFFLYALRSTNETTPYYLHSNFLAVLVKIWICISIHALPIINVVHVLSLLSVFRIIFRSDKIPADI